MTARVDDLVMFGVLLCTVFWAALLGASVGHSLMEAWHRRKARQALKRLRDCRQPSGWSTR